MRKFITIKGAREHNLKNVTLDIPRDKFVVFTGLSGSGKSSLAFDTLYAEGQRRFMESLSAWTRRFVQQQPKPKVEAVLGLSPVISIEQKTVNKNPRSTVGTMTDLSDYLRLLFASVGVARCLFCDQEAPIRSVARLCEHILSLPDGTKIEVCAPLQKLFGEEYSALFDEIRPQGVRYVRVDGAVCDMAEAMELDEDRTYVLEAIADRFVIRRDIEKQLANAVSMASKIGDGYVRIHLPEADDATARAFHDGFSCPEHRLTLTEPGPWSFSFNEPESACRTCSGLGTYLQVHLGLLVPDPRRSLLNGAFVREAFQYSPDSWAGRMVYTLTQRYNFSLETPFEQLTPEVQDILFHGTKGEKMELLQPPKGKTDRNIGKMFTFDGFANQIERNYRNYRKRGESHSGMEDYLRKVMVEKECPECRGGRLRPPRLRVSVGGSNIYELGQLTLEELSDFLSDFAQTGMASVRNAEAGRQIIHEIVTRLQLLIGIGLDYLGLNRRAATLSGGESQRIRLSTQISSELMGMLYVLDEPSIGLHPKDNDKLIATLRQLRDIGNTVIVVEHDEETIRAADYIVEMGPGPGAHGGEVVAHGSVDDLIAEPASLTGAFLSGRRCIEVPHRFRPRKAGELRIRGARENNLNHIDVSIPLGVLVSVTGASGSGKSTLINDILVKKVYSVLHDSRVLSGAHDDIDGIELIGDVINIDQSPIGRSSRSNPATYIGFYDNIRNIFTATEEARLRGYGPGRFSFNVKGGRCEDCSGEGTVTTSLNFMPDVEAICPACKGARFNAETLEVTFQGKNIAETLDLSVEEALSFFAAQKPIAHKLRVLDELGLGYITLGQAAPTLSGGEAQRVKLANELGKIKKGSRNLYILDEPTTGLHLADIERLLECLQRLVNAGNTVVVIEHHLDVIKSSDWIIDLGPDGGKHGGRVMATGTPLEVARCEASHTARYLRPLLELQRSGGHDWGKA